MRINSEIDKDDYAAEKAKIDKRIAEIGCSATNSPTEEVNVEKLLSFGLQYMTCLGNNWQTIKDPERKALLQKTVLKEGISYNKIGGAFSTPILSPIFALNKRFETGLSDLVAGPRFARGPTGYEPVELLLLHPAIWEHYIPNYLICNREL